jgi:hypothetical protein
MSLPLVFPLKSRILDKGLDYYWTLWKSDRAKDYIFDSTVSLKPYMNDLLGLPGIPGNPSYPHYLVTRKVQEKGF